MITLRAAAVKGKNGKSWQKRGNGPSPWGMLRFDHEGKPRLNKKFEMSDW